MRSLILFVTICFSINAFGESYYPKALPTRLLGLDQKEAGSCWSESEVTTLEFAFAARNYPILLSNYHRHAYNWSNPNTIPSSEELQIYEGNDKKLLQDGSSFFPLYLYPEDGRGFPRVDGRNRPSIQKEAVFLPGFPRLNIQSSTITFERPDGRWVDGIQTVNIAGLKNLVRTGQPFTFEINGQLMEFLKNKTKGTGILLVPYDQKLFAQNTKELISDMDHSVAVVGFDDDLYDGKGAFIIRNSWNDDREINFAGDAQLSPDPFIQNALKSFRLKISPVNLPGFYAVPYQFYQELIDLPGQRNGMVGGYGGGELFAVDYNQVYDIYSKYYGESQVYNVPLFCNRDDWDLMVNHYDLIQQQIQLNPAEGKANLVQLLMDQTRLSYGPSSAHKIPYFAKLAVSPKAQVDRVQDLAGERLADFYCAHQEYKKDANGNYILDKNGDWIPLSVYTKAAAGQFPTLEDLNDPGFKEILTEFQTGQGSLSVWYKFLRWGSCKKKNEGVCL